MFLFKKILMIIMFCIMLPLLNGCATLDSSAASIGGYQKLVKGDFIKALEECEENYNFSMKHSFDTASAYTANCVAASHYYIGNYKECKNWAERALSIAMGIDYAKDKRIVMGESQSILAAVQFVLGDYQDSIEYADAALRNLNNETVRKQNYLTLGQAHAFNGNYQQAFEALKKASGIKYLPSYNPIFQKMDERNLMVAFASAEAHKFWAEKDLDNALKKFEEIIDNLTGVEFNSAVFVSKKKIGDIYAEKNMINDAINNYKSALHYGERHGLILDNKLAAKLGHHLKSQEQLARAQPSLLTMEASFYDHRSIIPNNALDAGETAELKIVIKNSGKGIGFETKVEVSSDNPKIAIDKQIDIGDIQVGESKEIKIGIRSALDLQAGKATLHVALMEKRGYDARKVVLNIPTAKLEKPQLEIISTEISDGETGLAKGNGNGIPENGETIELTVLVKNNGEGKAIGVNLDADNKHSGIQWLRDSVHMATIQPGEIGKAKLAFSIPRGFDAREITTNLKVTDARGVNEADRNVVLSYAKRTPSIQSLFNIASRGLKVGTLANGQAYEMDVTFSNRGEISAKDVTASISAGRSIGLSETNFHIGEIKTGESVSKRIELRIPRTFAESQAQLRVDVSQADFPSTSEAIQYAVDVKRPRLTYLANLQSRNGGNTLDQGESSVLEVQVRNEGNLPANGVKVTVKSRDEKLKLGQTDSLVGIIPANSRSETIKIPVSTLRRIKTGDAFLDVNITQEDFPPVASQYAINVREEGAVVVDVESEERGRNRPVAKAQSGPAINLKGSPNELTTSGESYSLTFDAEDTMNIEKIIVAVNGIVILNESPGLKISEIRKDIPLKEGENRVAITAYNADNVSSRKELVITRLEEEDVDVPPITGIKEPDAVAVVIGISRYENKDVPRVDYARRDAATVKEYLVRSLGFDEKRVIELYDDGATLSKLNSFFRTKLKNLVVPGKSDVFVFYSGHGVPDVNKKEPYLAPYGLDPADVENTGYVLKDLYEQLARIDAKSVTVAIDSCFSGSSAGGAIIKDISPVFLDVSNPMLKVKNGVIFTASSSTQVSSWYDKKQHGLFTYFFLNGLRGKADKDNDGQVTVQELGEYVKRNVTEQARQLNREQTPEVTGAKEKVLIKYK